MKIALFGGTHGNEPVGVEVLQFFKNSAQQYTNPFSCFWSNPEAFEIKKRYVDCDLNRAFGANGIRQGHEAKRSQELETQVRGQFNFSIDLHTTTSNMGATVILNNTHALSRQAAAYLQSQIPALKIIEEQELDDACNPLNRLCPAGLTVEVGPVANNVVDASTVFQTHQIVELLLNFDFSTPVSLASTEYYQTAGRMNYPEEDSWYIHPELDRRDFAPLLPLAPMFINLKREVICYEGKQTVYPFFINEAAYLESRSAFLYAIKKTGFN